MYSFLINTLFSNEMAGSDLLFGSFAKDTEDTEVLSSPMPPPSYFTVNLFKKFLSPSPVSKGVYSLFLWWLSSRLLQIGQVHPVKCFLILLRRNYRHREVEWFIQGRTAQEAEARFLPNPPAPPRHYSGD